MKELYNLLVNYFQIIFIWDNRLPTKWNIKIINEPAGQDLALYLYNDGILKLIKQFNICTKCEINENYAVDIYFCEKLFNNIYSYLFIFLENKLVLRYFTHNQHDLYIYDLNSLDKVYIPEETLFSNKLIPYNCVLDKDSKFKEQSELDKLKPYIKLIEPYYMLDKLN